MMPIVNVVKPLTSLSSANIADYDNTNVIEMGSDSDIICPHKEKNKPSLDNVPNTDTKDFSKFLEGLRRAPSLQLVKNLEGEINIILELRGDMEAFREVKNFMDIKWIFLLANGNLLISGYVTNETLEELFELNPIVKIAPNFYIIEKNFEKVGEFKYKGVLLENEIKRNDIILDIQAAELLNAIPSWELGYNGSGITIAVIDTGVDFAAKPLEEKIRILDDWNALSFVPDGDSVALTPYVLNAYEKDGSKFLPTANRTFEFYDPFFGNLYTITLRKDYNVTGITSVSGNYHLGFIVEWIPSGIYYYGFVTPVLVTDSNTDSVYDTVWVDITFSLYYYATTFGLPVDANWLDYKFEGPYKIDKNNTSRALVAIDVYKAKLFNNGTQVIEFGSDGYYDYSLGIIGAPFIDSTGGVGAFLSGIGLEGKTFYQGIDVNGNWVGFLYDFNGHGTSVATTAAGKPTNYEIYYTNDSTIREITITGIAPEADIMGIRALSWGNIIEGWLYAAGFDLECDSTLNAQIWVYTGHHKADIISNSWGFSNLWAEYGYEMYSADILSILETSLSLNGSYFHQKIFNNSLTSVLYNITNISYYEPSVFIHAIGNGGPSYGTANTGPYSPLAIQVGASTINHWRPVYTNENEGYFDQVVWWSGRGPIISGFAGPDVVAIGGYAFEAIPPALIGSGSLAVSLFGGTSQAAPMVAGAAAIILQALNSTFGFWSPMIIKSLLMAGAIDAGYDVFSMGVGRINVNASVTIALNYSAFRDIVYVYSDFIQSFLKNVLGFPNSIEALDVGYPFINAGFIEPGFEKNLTLVPYTFLGDNDSIVKVSAYNLRLTKSMRIYLNLDPSESNFSMLYGKYYLFDLHKLGIDYENYDYIRFTAYFSPEEYYVSGISYMAVWAYKGSSVQSQSDIYLVNRFTGYGNIMTVEIGNPKVITDNLAIGFYSLNIETTGVRILVQLFKKVDIDNLVFSYAGDHDNISLVLKVPDNVLPGTYWCFINVTNDDGDFVLIPLIYHVIINAKTGVQKSFSNKYVVFNDEEVAKFDGEIDPGDIIAINVTLSASNYYRVVLYYQNVNVTPLLEVIDAGDKIVAAGYVSAPNQVFTWFRAEYSGDYVIKIKNLDIVKMYFELRVIHEKPNGEIGYDNSTMPNYNFINGYDWGWRSEVGEWRFFYLITNESSLINVTVSWSNIGSDAYLHVFHYNSGDLLIRHTPNYKGAGLYKKTFLDKSTILFSAIPNELYVIVIHAPILSGVSLPESFNITVSAKKYSGPYINLISLEKVIEYPNNLYFKFEVSSSYSIEKLNFTIDDIEVSTIYKKITKLTTKYWIVECEIGIHSLIEGKHNLTINAFDTNNYASFTEVFYIDSSTPILRSIIVNNEVITNEPKYISGTGSDINITIILEDTSPKMGIINIFNNLNQSFNLTTLWCFDIQKGGISENSGINNISAYFDDKTGRWRITVTVMLTDELQIEGYYLLDLYLLDYVNLELNITNYPILAIDSSEPMLIAFNLFEGEPTKIIASINSSISSNQKEHNITLSKGLEYNVFLSWDNELTDLDLYIYDPYGYLVAYSENYGPVPENVTFTAPIDGIYTIVISKYFGPETNYELTVKEIHTLTPIKAVGSNMSVVTFGIEIFDVSLSTLDIELNGEKIGQYSEGDAYWSNLGYYKFLIKINATLFNSTINNLIIVAKDSSQRTFTYETEILKDNNPPKVEVSFYQYVQSILNVTINAFDNETSVEQIEIYIDGSLLIRGSDLTNILINVSSLAEGKHVLKILAMDWALNIGAAQEIFYIDNTPPNLSILNFENGSLIGVTSTLLINVMDNVLTSHIRVYINDTFYELIMVEKGEYIYQMFLNLTNYAGDYIKIQFIATDMACNSISKIYIFEIDKNPPIIKILAPNYTMIRDFVINVTIIDNNLYMAEIYIDDVIVATTNKNGTITIPIYVKNVSDGTHTIKVIAYDKAGNVATLEREFTTGYYKDLVAKERSKVLWYSVFSALIGVIIGVTTFYMLGKWLKKGKKTKIS